MRKTIHYRCGLFVYQFILLCACFHGYAQDEKKRFSDNLLVNPSFEEGLTGWSIPEGMATVSHQRHIGAQSIEFHNPDSSVYKFITQEITPMPGKRVRISAWAKGQNVQSKSRDRGIFIFVQAYDANGKHLGGTYRHGYIGTFDWLYLERLYQVPSNTTKVVVGMGMRKRTTGKVWFDDITIQAEDENYSPVSAFLLYPNYRGITTKKSKTPWQILLKTHLPFDWSQSEVSSVITDMSGKVLLSETVPLSSNSRECINLYFDPTGKVDVGNYHWNLELKSTAIQKPRTYNFSIHVQEQMPSTYIDDEGFTVVDGKRFFPFGVYLGGYWSATNTDLERISQAGLNTILAYQSGIGTDTKNYLARAHAHELHVIYSLKDMYPGHQEDSQNSLSPIDEAAQHIRQWANSPSLLAWYINDEFSPPYIPQVQTMYEQVKNLDPQHPAYQVLVEYDDIREYFTVTDAWGTDPYPILGNSMRPIRYVSNLTEKTVEESYNAKSTWQVLQIFDNSVYTAKETVRPPTLAEMRNMSYQAIINGAKGILYYSYYDLYFTDYSRDPTNKASTSAFNKRWPDVQKTTMEIASLVPVILKNHKVPLFASPHQFAHFQAWQDGNSLYLLVVNTDSKNNSLSLHIPHGWQLTKQNVPGISSKLKNDHLEINLASQASGTLILKK